MSTFIISVILLAAVAGIIRSMIRDKKAGKGCAGCAGGCGGGCAGCSGSCQTHTHTVAKSVVSGGQNTF